MRRLKTQPSHCGFSVVPSNSVIADNHSTCGPDGFRPTLVPMKIIRSLLVILFMAASPGLVQAGAAGAEANDTDAALNKVYGKLQASLGDEKQKKLLLAAETAWIKDRDANVALFAERYPFSKGGLFYKTYLTVERTKFLQALLDNAGGDEAEGPIEYQQ
jgi:uncharacterized protein YecT (DUF1311 family)